MVESAQQELRFTERGAGQTPRVAGQQRVHQCPQQELPHLWFHPRNEPLWLQTLTEVLTRLQSAGMRLNREKCTFMADEVVYLGHRINREGIQPTNDKVQAISATPRPVNTTQLRAFLGLVNFYGKFMNNLSTILAPLYHLLRKKAHWR